MTNFSIAAMSILSCAWEKPAVMSGTLRKHWQIIDYTSTANPPIAMRYLKQGLRMSTFGDVEQLGAYVANSLAYLFTTEDHREGALSFVEKREPVFKGR